MVLKRWVYILYGKNIRSLLEDNMLKNIPKALSPEIIAVLCEMGHSDRIIIGDANFPGKKIAEQAGIKFLRADGISGTTLLDAMLTLIPCDAYVEDPVKLMQKMECDADLEIPIWAEYERIVAKHDKRGKDAMRFVDRFDFYEEAKQAFCIVQSGEEAIYANIMIQKGVIK